MHSFHHSRGRTLFEVFCALVIAASCVGAWVQTGAWTLLPAASAVLLYGFVHAFDLRGRSTAGSVKPQRIDFATEGLGELPARLEADDPPTGADQQPEASSKDTETVEPTAPQAKPGRRAKAPRKGGRRTSAPKDVRAIEPAPLEEADVTELMPREEAEPLWPMSEATAQPHIEPLFEPEPFVRMPRRAFGRKAG